MSARTHRPEYALTPDVRLFVEKAVQDLDAEVRHADLINIGETEREPYIHILLVLDDRSELAADIAAGLLHLQEQFFNFQVLYIFISDSVRVI